MSIKRKKLLSLINRYLNQENIKMSYVLGKYKDKLENGKRLKESEFENIIPLLKWNMKMTPEELRVYFSEVVGSGIKKKESNSVQLMC